MNFYQCQYILYKFWRKLFGISRKSWRNICLMLVCVWQIQNFNYAVTFMSNGLNFHIFWYSMFFRFHLIDITYGALLSGKKCLHNQILIVCYICFKTNNLWVNQKRLIQDLELSPLGFWVNVLDLFVSTFFY